MVRLPRECWHKFNAAKILRIQAVLAALQRFVACCNQILSPLVRQKRWKLNREGWREQRKYAMHASNTRLFQCDCA